MDLSKILRKYLPYIVITVVLLVSLLFIWSQNSSKALILLVIILSWFISGIVSKKFFQTTLLFIFLVLPFNITIQLPESISVFNSTILISHPYVGGLWINYLVPTLSIIDIFVFALLVVGFYEYREYFIKALKNRILIIFVIFLLIQNLIVQQNLVVFESVHLYSYILAVLVAKEFSSRKIKLIDLLQSCYFKTVLVSGLLVQGLIGVLQFVRGASLGLSFLGESNIVNGMLGSSFIDINGQSFLRAYGTFPHPNIFAGWLVLNFILFGILFTKSKHKVLPVLGISLSVFFSFFTFSRVSILILLLLCIVFSLYYMRERKIFSFTGILFTRFLNLFSSQDTSLSDRVSLIKVNWDILKQNWLFGTGLENSTRHYLEKIPITNDGMLLLQPVHNIFMLSIVELGLFGGIYFWFLNYVLFIKGNRFTVIKWCILGILFVIGMFDHFPLSLSQGNAILYIFLILISY